MRKNSRNVFYKTRVPLVKLAQRNIDRSKCALPATDETRAARNSCSKGNIVILRNTCWKWKGNIDRSKCALVVTHKIYVYILRSKYGKTPEMFSTKRVPLVINARKGISIVASVLWQQHKIYFMCLFFVLNVEKHQKCFL